MAISKCSVQTNAYLNADAQSAVDPSLKEIIVHGTAAFPAAIYHDDIAAEGVIWHWHEELEAGIVTKGEILFEYGRGSCVLRKGDGFFINAGTLHAMKGTRPGVPAELKSIVFHACIVGGEQGSIYDERYIKPLVRNRAASQMHLHKDVPAEAEIMRAIRAAWTAAACEEEDLLTFRDALTRMCAALLQIAPRAETASTGSILREDRVQALLDFIHRNYDRKVTLPQIAAAANISVNEALRCFKPIIGFSPIQYLNRYRLDKAAQLLRESDNSVVRICEMCGIGDCSAFARQFRLEKGCTPTEYRAAQNGKKR